MVEEHVKLKFMRRNKFGLYGYTQEPEAVHPTSDIVQEMPAPSITKHGRRASFYKYEESTVKDLAAKFVLK